MRQKEVLVVLEVQESNNGIETKIIKRKIVEEKYEYDTDGVLIYKTIITTTEEENSLPTYFYNNHDVKLP